MKPTEAQRRAVQTRQNTIVIAGAGSGKTRVLVERYLALLEENPHWSLNALVAITFTRKAAGEMRDRVRSTLYQRRLTAPTAELQRRWTELLGAMDSARITTIHGLCADILRANAAEAGLDPDFTVLDETQTAALLSTVIQDTFDTLTLELDENGNPSPALRVFDFYTPDEVYKALISSGAVYADYLTLPADLMTYWQTLWQNDADQALQRLTTHPRLTRIIEWAIVTFFPPADKITEVWNQTFKYLERILNETDFSVRYDALTTLVNGKVINLVGGSAKAWGGKEIFDETKDHLKFIRALVQDTAEYIGDPPGELDEQAARLLPAWLALIERVRRAYNEAKTRQAALDFDDLERLTAQLLEAHPHVVARYQNAEYQHLLIDEFQDTNQRQWTIAQHLAGLMRPGSLFVVGDPKQSIYAFRGADVSVFNSVQGSIMTAGGESVDLARSFRTHAPLVTRFNALFTHILATDDSSPVRKYQVAIGAPMDAHRQTPPNDDPALELILIDQKRLPESDERLKAADLRRWEAYEIAERLHTLVKTGYLIYDKELEQVRPVTYGDMALLFQSMSKITIYEEVFRALGLPFLTIAGRGYYDRQEVHDLLNLLRALYNPDDDLALAAALRSPLFNLSDDALYALRLNAKTMHLWAALAEPHELLPEAEQIAVSGAHDLLTRLHALAGRVTISELLRLAVAETGYLATLTALPGGAQRRGNVEKLLEKAQSSGKITLSDFTYYLDDLSTREVREGDAALDAENVVRLMTVHASKGLEFPVVGLPDAGWTKGNAARDLLTITDGFGCKVQDADGKSVQPFAYRRAIRLQNLREDAERRRLLYVAATRAQDLLIISGQADTEKREAKGWLTWLLEAIPHDDSGVRVHIPTQNPPPEKLIPTAAALSGWWDRDPVATGKAIPDTPILVPPMVAEVQPRKRMQARHLAATSIADLGGFLYADNDAEAQVARDRFRRKLLYDAPAVIPRVQFSRHTPVSARQVGEIVHEALRWWSYPFEDMDIRRRADLLSSYAWENGITDDEARIKAVRKAADLLRAFTKSHLYQQIREAAQAGLPVFREMPFIYERDKHIVHGIMDILFQKPGTDGEEWVLADYKTSRLRQNVEQSAVEGALARHARRYHLQVGVYAEAAQRHLGGIVPQVFIHYIGYGTSVEIPAEAWQTALAAGLSTSVLKLIERS